MRTILCGLALLSVGGCFDEGGDEVRTQSALKTADGVLAFADLQNNLFTDKTAAGEALVRFMSTPIAAYNLIAPPFDLGEGTNTENVAFTHPSDLPDCLTTSGETGCDSFNTNAGDTCVAGGFTFSGTGSRQCMPECKDVEGTCRYDWNLKLGYSDPKVVWGYDLSTRGPATVSKNEVTFDTHWDFTLSTHHAQIRVCSCGAATVRDFPPRRLVNSSFVVKDDVFVTLESHRCALVTFDGEGNPSAVNKCSCADGVTCSDSL